MKVRAELLRLSLIQLIALGPVTLACASRHEEDNFYGTFALPSKVIGIASRVARSFDLRQSPV
jgi:hypothetical protein